MRRRKEMEKTLTYTDPPQSTTETQPRIFTALQAKVSSKHLVISDRKNTIVTFPRSGSTHGPVTIKVSNEPNFSLKQDT